MHRAIWTLAFGAFCCLCWAGHADGRGFGGFGGYHAGGFGGYGGGYHSFGGYGGGYRGYSGGYRSSDFGSYRGGVSSYGGYRNFGADRSIGYAGGRSFNTYSGWHGGVAGTSTYDRSYTDARGGTINTEGERGAAVGPRGGVAAGGTRDTQVTTAGGRTYDGERQGGAAVGPYGRVVGGGTKAGVATGPRGTVASESHAEFAGTRFPTDTGLARYSSFNAAGVGHSTAYWSHGYMADRGVYVRNNFNYWHCFNPGWYGRYPGAWFAAGWLAGAAWTPITWPVVYDYVGFGSEPPYTYDYGSNIVYQNNNVYVGGQDAGTAQAYAQEATTIADTGINSNATPQQDWKPMGVYALVQGNDKTSNNIFQLAVNKDGIIRGNFYDGVADTTTEVYGSVDKKTQRCAWTIGKKKDRVFEAGLYNLTQSEAPVLVHFGGDKTQQWLLVRMEQPPQKTGAQ